MHFNFSPLIKIENLPIVKLGTVKVVEFITSLKSLTLYSINIILKKYNNAKILFIIDLSDNEKIKFINLLNKQLKNFHTKITWSIIAQDHFDITKRSYFDLSLNILEEKKQAKEIIELSREYSKQQIFITKKAFLNSSFFKKTRSSIAEQDHLLSVINLANLFKCNGKYDLVLVTITHKTHLSLKETLVCDLAKKETVIQKQQYITDQSLPNWIIFRNELFDSIYNQDFNLCTSTTSKDLDTTNLYLLAFPISNTIEKFYCRKIESYNALEKSEVSFLVINQKYISLAQQQFEKEEFKEYLKIATNRVVDPVDTSIQLVPFLKYSE